MVYRKSNIKVLLGPEKLQAGEEVNLKRFEGNYHHNNNDDDEQIIVKPYANRRTTENQVFEKIGETNVYKRTRPFHVLQGRPKIERIPSNLQLSGQKCDNEETKQPKLERGKTSTSINLGEEHATSPTADDMDRRLTSQGEKAPTTERDLKSADSGYSPSLVRPKREKGQSSANNIYSQNFLTEFGLRTERTDTFSGHQRRRGASADLERQLEMSAERHIRTCQVVGNVKRSSRANQSYQGLKDYVSPLHSPGSACFPTDRFRRQNSTLREKSFFRSDLSLDKSDTGIPCMIQIRKNVGNNSRIKGLGKPFTTADAVQGINSRTIIVGTKFC